MMDIYVLNGLNGVLDVIDTFESVIWNVQYFGRNDFELKVAGTSENLNLLSVGALLVRDIDMSDGTYQNVMRVDKRKLDFDTEKGWVLTVTGKGLKNIVANRIVWIQTNLTGSVEKGIRQVMTENIISPTDSNRAIPNFILSEENGFTDTFDIQLLGENIGEWLESTCTNYGYGWDVYISNNKYVFSLYKGTDRSYNQSAVVPVVFSPEFDNLLSSSYTYGIEEFKNAALIGGEGEGTKQRVASVGSATGLDRIETYIDASTVSSNGDIITVDTYLKMLEDYGNEQLSTLAFTEKFEGVIIPDGMYKLNQDYFLGDIVQIVNEKGISATTRIIEIIYSEDANGTNVVPTFSEWEVN